MKLPFSNLIFVVIFSLVLNRFNCQETEQSNATGNVASSSATSNSTGNLTAPVLTDPYVQLMNAQSIEEALSLGILYKNNHLATAADLGAETDPETGKLMVSGGGSLAVPDNCHPREVGIEITVDNLSPSSRLYPQCIKVTRCGGCCGANHVQCKPQYIERTLYHLIELSMYGPAGMSVVGDYPVEIERHLSCECECTLSQDKCGPLKSFDDTACACHCIDTSVRCFPPFMFSPETCGCECVEYEECCPLGDDCGLYFNRDNCGCELDSGRQLASNTGVNLTQSNINRYLGIVHGSGGNSQNNPPPAATPSPTPPPTTTTTSTTTTTPTTTSTPPSPCAGVRCPGGFTLSVSGGRCHCSRQGPWSP